MNRKLAELFAQFIFDSIVAAGGKLSTAHRCMGVWWEAIENGEFGQ